MTDPVRMPAPAESVPSTSTPPAPTDPAPISVKLPSPNSPAVAAWMARGPPCRRTTFLPACETAPDPPLGIVSAGPTVTGAGTGGGVTGNGITPVIVEARERLPDCAE